MRIVVPPGVFRPRSDSWQLADAAAATVRPGERALDLCTGSGVVAVAMARAGAAEVVAVDASRAAAWTARLNGLINGARVRARPGDLFAAVPGQRFDVITSNPPYLPGQWPRPVARHVAGGPDGRAVLDRIIAAAPAFLRPGGRLLLIHSSVCGIDTSLERLQAVGLRPSVLQRTTGRLGPLLQSRAGELARTGLIEADRREDIAIIVATPIRPQSLVPKEKP